MDRDTAIERMPGAVQDNSLAGAVQSDFVGNNYYRDAFRNMMWIVNVQAVIIICIISFFVFYVKTAENHDRFFAETVDGKKMQMIGLNLPNMGKMALANWASQAAVQIMTFGFNDIDQRFALSRINFTPEGWKLFNKAMTKSELIDSVIKAQQVITAAPKDIPVLVQEGLINGKYSWVFEMKILLTFRSGGVKQASTKTVRILVEKVPTSENPSGVGIGEWYIW